MASAVSLQYRFLTYTSRYEAMQLIYVVSVCLKAGVCISA